MNNNNRPNPFTKKENTVSTGFYYDTRLKLICYIYVTEDGEKLIYNRLPKIKKDGMFYIPKNHTKISDIVDISYMEMIPNTEENQHSLMYDLNWIYEEEARIETFKDFLINNELYLMLQLLQTYDKHRGFSKEYS